MKKYILLFTLFLSFGLSFAQTKDSLSVEEQEKRKRNIEAGNPFKKFGYTPKIATLSKGKYLEWHDLDSIVRIGSYSFHVKKKDITGYNTDEDKNSESTLRPELTSRWLSPDPLAEEFPSWSPYNFVYNNPIRYTDPTGLAPEDWVKKDGKWTWDENITSAEQAKAAGYDDYRAPGSIIDNAMINGKTGSGGKTSVYLGQNSNDVSFTYPNSTVTPFQVGTEWLSGNGPRNREFTNGDFFTELLKTHDHIEGVRGNILAEIANGAEVGKTGSAPYGLGGVQGVGKYVKDYSTLATAGQTGNLAVTYLGSYGLTWNITGISNGTATVQFTATNSSTMQSASRPPILGYTPLWQNTMGSAINNYFSSGWGSRTTQTFNWTETLKIN